MSSVILQSNYINKGTLIPNLFIDTYMPRANGAYVKVYLYLIRCLSDDSINEINISTIADHFENTERDIIRALCYWEKLELISMKRDDNDKILSITINDIYSINNNLTSQDEPAVTMDTYQEYSNTSHLDTNDQHQDQIEELKDQHDDNKKQYQFDKPTYSDAQIEQITNSDEIKWMLNIIELYIQRLVKPMDLQLIIYLYESLDFSTELILYLYEYCVSKNKTHPSYVEAVAIAWAQDGIDSLEKAEAATASYNESYNIVKKSFGLNRALGHVEKKYVNKWTQDYKFSSEIIVEACDRTILTIQKPDFKYTDKILENWHNKGIKSLSEIRALDEEHKKSSKNSSSNKQKNNSNGSKNTNNNRFNAFPQRSYSKEDYSSLEKKLLHKKNN